MGFPIHRLISLGLGIFLISWTGFGSSLRVVQKPQPFTFSTEELHISCIADDPSYMTKSILSMQIMRHIEDKPIAVISERGTLKTAVGIKDNVKANGHIDTKSKKGYLTLIVDKPHRQDAGTYRCQMFVMNEDLQLVEKNVIGNVTYQESDIAGVVTHLARKLTSLLTRFDKQNVTLQTLKKQHTTFKHVHSGQKLDMDNLIDQIDSQNNTMTEQNKQQKLEIDILTDEMDRQKSTNIKQTKQIGNQNTIIKKQETETKKQDTEIKKLDTEIKKQDTEIKKQDTEIKKQDTEIKKQDAEIKKQNNTLQTLEKQHTDFKSFHSEQKLDMDNLIDNMDSQNNTDMKLIKQIEKQDTLIDNQTKQIERLNALVDKLNTDNTQKQQQLDTLLDYIQRQNKTIYEHEIELERMSKRVFFIDWTYYQGDNTFIKVFGKDDVNKRLSWSEARESCQSIGGDLVVIRDAQKNNFVYNLFGGTWTWIGVRNYDRRGFDFKYVDGSAVGGYQPWWRSNPDGDADNDEKCVEMSTGTSDPGEWDDNFCSNKRSYVCSVSSINVS